MRVENSYTLDALAEDVWAAFSDWGAVYRFQPWVAESPILGGKNEGVGASRRCEFVDNTSIVETITRIEKGRRIEMHLSDTPKPITAGRATIQLSPRGERTSVSVEMNFELGLGPLNPIMGSLFMKPMMRKRIRKMLESLEYHLKTGGKIDSKGNRIPAPRQTVSNRTETPAL